MDDTFPDAIMMSGHMPTPGYSVFNREDGGVELALPSQLGFERAARDAVGMLARAMGFSDARVEDIQTAVAEATLNAMEHGNHLDHTLLVRVIAVPSPHAMEVQVWDQSTVGFRRGLVGTRLPEAIDPGRGRGLFLMEALADRVEYATTPTGNRVSLWLDLDRTVAPAGE